MGDVHYLISETAKQLGVESHVLRYWEEELELPIGRTDMGHRHYTEDDIQLFSCIKELKEQGMQLKEIKEILPDMLRAKKLLRARRKQTGETPAQKKDRTDREHRQMTAQEGNNVEREHSQTAEPKETAVHTAEPNGSSAAVPASQQAASSGAMPASQQAVSSGADPAAGQAATASDRSADLERLCLLLSKIVQDAMLDNNRVLEDRLCLRLTENISKNMDFQLQARERQEEDRYRKLDALIRQQQSARRETARLTPARCLHRIFGEN